MQAYSDPNRANDPHALPNVEVWYRTQQDVDAIAADRLRDGESECDDLQIGWYWWSCFTGCLPDGEPNGPFDTQAEALADAQDCD